MIDIANELPYAGQTGRAVEFVERALRLDPALIDRYRCARRDVYFYARRFEDAARTAEAMDHPSKLSTTLIYAQLGRAEELARWRSALLAETLEFSAELRLDLVGDFLPTAVSERALFLESIAKAGLPTCATPEQLAKKPGMRRMPECAAERAKLAAPKT
jgi:hypothetical protein